MNKKKYIASLFVLFLLVTVGVTFALPSSADEGDAEIAKGLSGTAIWIFNAILYILRLVAILLASLGAMFLTKMFWITVSASSTVIPAVPIVWAALRDLANGLFLLIILWISLTIIFGLEQWGGRKLLVQVILVALLINFSLLAVTVVVGASNFVAKIFADEMPPDPGKFILQSIDAQNTGTAITQAGLAELKANEARKLQETQSQTQKVNAVSNTGDAVLAAVGIQTAQAAELGRAACFAGFTSVLAGQAAVARYICNDEAVSAAFDWMFGWSKGFFNSAVDTAVRLILQTIFLLIAALTMFYGAIVLLLRFAIIAALSVVAPLAFLAAAVPTMKKWFDLWLSELVRWSFFLPMFYLMMYLGFYIISTISASATVGPGVLSIDRIIIVFVGLLFMLIGLRLARKTGGAIADSVVSGVTKLGLFAATGGAGLAMKGMAAEMAARPETTQNLAARARRIPLIGRQIQKAMGAPVERDRKEVEKREEEMKHFSPSNLKTHFESTGSRHDKIAAARLLVKAEKLDLIERQQQEAYRLASNVGMAKEFLELNPALAVPTGTEEKPEAIKKAISRLKDKTKISWDAITKDPQSAAHAGAVIEGVITHTNTKQLSQIGMNNKALLNAAVEHLNGLTLEQTNELKRNIRETVGEQQLTQLTNYFRGEIAGNIGPRLGWTTPRHWEAATHT